MRSVFSVICLSLVFFALSCDYQNSPSSARDGVFIHISHGVNHAHRVLMAFQMAQMMSENKVNVNDE